MSRDLWQTPADGLQDDAALLAAVVEQHRLIYDRQFRDQPEINHRLPVMTHAFRRLGQWRVFLLLTPWMLARLFVPDAPPDIEIPEQWRADSRKRSPYTVIGPAFDLHLLSGRQKVHLNHCPDVGHYLLHPLILSMTGFGSPEEVFQAWNGVIEARNQTIRRLQRQNPQQEEISRREFFSGVLGR